MTPAEISQSKGASDVFEFIYDNLDVLEAQVFEQERWAPFVTTGGVQVDTTVRPGFDDSGASLPGTWTCSITLFHLTTFSSARVEWEGSGFTMEYTLDGTNFSALPQDGVVVLNGDSDFDVRVTFAGGIQGDTAALTRLTAYVLETEAMESSGSRTATLTNNAVTDSGLTTNASPLAITVSPESTNPVGTIEAWVSTGAGTTIFSGLPAAATYRNGASGSATANNLQHIVAVLNTAANTALSLPTGLTVSHLAIYPQRMTAAEVAALYTAQNPQPIRIDDAGIIAVTELADSVDIYAYDWSIVAGSAR